MDNTGCPQIAPIFQPNPTKYFVRVPETATVLLGGGVNFAELPDYAQIEFQV